MSRIDILLILSDLPTAKLLDRRMLRSAGYSLAQASSWKAAQRLIERRQPGLVMMSDSLEGVDSLERAAGLIERHPEIPFILLPEAHSDILLLRALRLGFTDYLQPPFQVDDVLRVVRGALRRKEHFKEWALSEIVLAQIEEGVILVDFEGRLLVTNRKARADFGLGGEDLAGKHISEVFDNPDLLEILAQENQSGPAQVEITLDNRRVVNAQLSPIPGTGLAITMQDITRFKELDLIKSEFVSTVSHDLRSPLTAILGYVELIERVGPVNEQQREFIRRAELGVFNITALINDLLDLGRIEAGFDSRKELVQLPEIARSSLESFRNQAGQKNQELVIDIPEDLPQVLGNPLRLRQMLNNLISNAVKYTPESGEVILRARAERGQIILQVADTGAGIPPVDQPYIFDKFFRSRSIPQDIPGTGLGLAIVKSIVENHQGRIWVDSLPGLGTTFTVVLPIAKT